MLFKKINFRWTFGISVVVAVLLLSFESSLQAQAVPVKLEKQNGQWRLLRDGKPYYVKGAGGLEGTLEYLAVCGGNSNRLWGEGPEVQARLDEAHKNGISVAMGIWLEHERHGFDYDDTVAVKKQFEESLKVVEKYKDHPAILVWGVGNEMEGDGSNPKIFQHIEELCQAIKKLDPNHPTMSVMAEIGGGKVGSLHKHCPSLDIIGINSYGGSASLPRRYRAEGGTKPYLVTEFGPIGTWEIPKNEFGAITEPLSAAKAETYRVAIDGFEKEKELCLGYYAFLWGHKQEATPTWFGMLLPDGKKTAPVDVVIEKWTGKAPENRCPKIDMLSFSGGNQIEPGEKLKVNLKASDPENNKVNVRWTVLKDAAKYVTGGDKQALPPSVPGVLSDTSSMGATLTAPKESGIYRVYAYIDDGKAAAVGNLPFWVGDKDLKGMTAPVKLPYFVYRENEDVRAYVPSGWMGNTESIKVDENCKTAPKSGTTCVECEFTSTRGWGGVVWQNPPEDWGDKAGGLNFTGATQLTFWAKGARGGEEIKFGFGLLGREKKFFDTGKKEVPFQLTQEWKQYTIKLERTDLRRIKTGFYWALSSSNQPIKFYLDDIQFSK